MEPHDDPIISGFTPINRPQICSSPVKDLDSNVSQGAISTKKGWNRAIEKLETKGKKCKNSNYSGSGAPKGSRKTTTSCRSKERYISKDLPRKKPGLEGHDSFTDKKRKISNGLALSDGGNTGSKLPTIREEPLREVNEVTSCTPTLGHASCPPRDRHFSLAERYQVARGSRTASERDDDSVSQSFQISSDISPNAPVQAFRNEHDEPIQLIAQRMHKNSIVSQPFNYEQILSLQDFEPPPSAQPPSMAFGEPSDPDMLQADAHSLYGSPSRDCDVHDTDDPFLDNFDELLASEQDVQPRGSGISDLTILDDGFVDEFGGWPDDVSLPDAVAIYDEDLEMSSDDEFGSGGPPAPQSSNILNDVSGNMGRASQFPQTLHQGPENEFDDSELEPSLADPSPPIKALQPSTPHTSPELSSSPKLQWLPPKTFTPGKSRSSAPVLPLDVSHLVPRDAAGTYLPFARPSFPKPVLDRSPILGLTNTTVLRTCFRIGEALNAAAQASRSNTDAIIELYARVSASLREANGGFKQSFQFADLFTDKPPYLSGTSIIWKGVGLWDHDSRVFLGEVGRGKKCRVVGRIRRGQAGGCGMTVLSIWEVDWEDVGVAKGVVCS